MILQKVNLPPCIIWAHQLFQPRSKSHVESEEHQGIRCELRCKRELEYSFDSSHYRPDSFEGTPQRQCHSSGWRSKRESKHLEGYLNKESLDSGLLSMLVQDSQPPLALQAPSFSESLHSNDSVTKGDSFVTSLVGKVEQSQSIPQHPSLAVTRD